MLVIIGTIITATSIIGSMMLGDSIKHSLKNLMYKRIGNIEWVLNSQDKFLPSKCLDLMEEKLGIQITPAIILSGITGSSGGKRRVNNVNVVGVDNRFFKLFPKTKNIVIPSQGAFINKELALKLNLKIGDEFTLSLIKPESISKDMPFSKDSDYVGFRLKVIDICDKDGFGSFSLKINSKTTPSIFVSMPYLSEELGISGKFNTILVHGNHNYCERRNFNNCDCRGERRSPPNLLALTKEDVDKAFSYAWNIEYGGYYIKDIPGTNNFELRTKNVFIPDSIIDKIKEIYPDADYIFSYFVNSIKKDNNVTPYSFVSTMLGYAEFLRDDEIIINTWLKEDLNAEKLDNIEIEYFVIDSSHKLSTKKSTFTVHSVVSVDDSPSGQALMPDIPGLSSEGNCQNWDTGIPIDFSSIRKKDEDYWNNYRGTPKAYISKSSAEKIWGNIFGKTTSIRFNNAHKDEIINQLNEIISPSTFGLHFKDIRSMHTKSINGAIDFSQLFIGLSFFLVIASLILIGIFFSFYVEARFSEIETLKALGYTNKMIYRIFISEGIVIATLGVAIAIPTSIIYDHVFLYALENLWYDAIRIEISKLHVNLLTVLIGFLISIFFALVPMFLSLRAVLNKKRNDFLKIKTNGSFISKQRILAFISPVLVIFIFAYNGIIKNNYLPILFFISGTLSLIEGILLTNLFIRKDNKNLKCNCVALNGVRLRNLNNCNCRGERRSPHNFTIKSLGISNIKRNPSKSLATIGILSVGIFMVISVAINIKTFLPDTSISSSGTGGFSLFSETTYPLNIDLNSSLERKKIGLNEKLYKDVKFVALRLNEGDDASCLNPNKIEIPRILGVDSEEFSNRNAFTFEGVLGNLVNKKKPESHDIWRLLESERDNETIPAISDMATIKWALGKKLGDVISLIDDNGERIELKLVAGLADSIFQGSLIISEENFLKHFPSSGGFRIFLIDNLIGRNLNNCKCSIEQRSLHNSNNYRCRGERRSPSNLKNNIKEIISDLSNKFLTEGIEVTQTSKRLLEFNSVQNTYIFIFLVLGSFGLILGTVGLGVLILRNTIEREGELALLNAIGYTKKLITKMLLYEYMFLLFSGIIIGLISSSITILPFILKQGTKTPYLLLLFAIILIALSGFLSIYFASKHVIKASFLGKLRLE